MIVESGECYVQPFAGEKIGAPGQERTVIAVETVGGRRDVPVRVAHPMAPGDRMDHAA